MVIFIKKYDGKTKDSGRDFHCYTLAECKTDENGNTSGYVRDFYTDKPLNVAGLNFGDVVNPVFDQPLQLGGRPVLTAINKIADSPYIGF